MNDNQESEVPVKNEDNVDASEKNFFQRLFSKKQEVVSLKSLFRYATFIDIIFMLIGTAGGLAHGTLLPLLVLVLGSLINTFTQRTTDLCALNLTSVSLDYCPTGYQLTPLNYYSSISICHLNITTFNFEDTIKTETIYLVIIGCISIVVAYIQVAFWSMSTERQTKTIRENLFRSILRKDIVYFDTHKTGELNTRLIDDVEKIRDGIGDKIASAAQFLSSFFTGCIIGFVKGWKLTLVMLSIAPLIFISVLSFSKIASSFTTMEIKAYGKAGAIAEEVFSSIRTVLSYNGQEREEKRKYLDEAKRSGIKKCGINGFIRGIVWFVIYCSYALGLGYGAKLVREDGYNIGDVAVVFFCIIIAVFNLGQVSPHFEALTAARAAAYIVWEVIDAPSKINSDSETGLKKDDLIGDIHFSNVHFSYPSRPGVQILNGLSFDVKHGQIIALIGSSGSGKSTCIQLLQRFYDPGTGSISIDGHQVTEYNLKWLRQHIGVVSQEPILFQASIRENILFGRDSATDEQIHQSAKMANAHDFIMTLPDKYETQVGERGATLSGGQKQRIAIARALIRDPKILLLDEATSALDNESEKIVQDALDHAAEGRTTLVIAHRLSTIRNADKIVVVHKGQVVEVGDHETLMGTKGIYVGLVEQQNLHIAEEEEEQQENAGIGFSNQTEENEQHIKKRRVSSINNALHRKYSTTEEGDDDKKKEKVPNAALEMLKMNKPEWIFIVIGCIVCIINGGTQPVFGVILSKLVAAFQDCDNKVQESKVLLYILLFIGLGIIIFIAMFLQNFLFACSGEALTKRLRSKTFHAILSQEMAFFDNPKNNTGALCTCLATEASAVQGATGITVESIQNIRTVIQLTKEDYFHKKYCLLLQIPYVSSIKRANIYGVIFGLTNSVMFFSLAAIFRLGAYLVDQNSISYESLLIVFNCITYSAQSVGFTASLTPDYKKAVEAAEKILETINRKSAIDNGSNSGDEITNFRGELDFEDIHFIYPTRPESIILNNFKLKIKAGQQVALVGTSGCGKSTTIQLIERFYDPNLGRLLADSKDIRSLNLQWYRSQIGIVSQEPILFDMSIRENIAYGDNSRNDISMKEIIEAAKNANIHDFIQCLLDGYETNCGAKGTQLSGGEKQRIGKITRALIRNPKILLLDEATSALDSDNEKIVQEALDRAQQNRTSITIAHRLSTIQNADVICVLHNGIIIESGTHQELLALGGRYYRLAIGKLKYKR